MPNEPTTPRNRRLLWATPLVLVGLWFAVQAWWRHGTVATDNAYLQANLVMIASPLEGRVVSVPVREHQAVKAGDILFVLDPAPFEAAQRQAHAKVEVIRQQIQATRARWQGAQAAEERAAMELSQAKNEQKRLGDMGKRQLVAKQVEDDAVWAARRAEARHEEAKAGATDLRHQVQGQLEAELLAAQAMQDQAFLDHERSIVRAPVSGIVGKLQVYPGTVAGPSRNALVLVETATIHVEANFKETEIARLQAGQSATVSIDAYPGVKFPAAVKSVSPATGAEFSVLPAQNASGNWIRIVQRVPVHLVFDDPDDPRLRVGLSAKVRVNLAP